MLRRTGAAAVLEAAACGRLAPVKTRFQIPAIVRRRATNLGDEGLAWIDTLDDDVATLGEEWGLRLGQVLHGGSEALVVEARTAANERVVLKVGQPGSESGRREAAVLLAANGNGYARVFQQDEARRAMLLERLGPQLDQLGLPVDAQIAVICETLKLAWLAPATGARFETGAEKAANLAAFILQLWEALERPCSERVIERALTYARKRGEAFAPERAVLAHGDGHEANTLQVPGARPPAFKFVDPDGLLIEPAYDLAICMRGWGSGLLEGDAFELGRKRLALLSRLTGVEPGPIWEWGFIERVSTGLLLKQLGAETESAEYLAVAERWAMADGH